MGNKSLTIALFLFLAAEIKAIEFFYTVQDNIDNCFEDYLTEQILMTGEVYFDTYGLITLTVEDLLNTIVLTKVSVYYYFRIFSKINAIDFLLLLPIQDGTIFV